MHDSIEHEVYLKLISSDFICLLKRNYLFIIATEIPNEQSTKIVHIGKRMST
jgi:hypothetical protein